jgi:hypothetical protein
VGVLQQTLLKLAGTTHVAIVSSSELCPNRHYLPPEATAELHEKSNNTAMEPDEKALTGAEVNELGVQFV